MTTLILELLLFFLPALLTAAVEMLFFSALGYHSRDAIIVIICTNILANVTVNAVFSLIGWKLPEAYLAELLVAAAEYAIFACAFGRSKKLFLLTLAANALTFGLGLIIFQH
jgi:hypothetical protein